MPPTNPLRATASLTRLGLPTDLAPCCVIGIDPGATTGVAVIWCNGDKTAHALLWEAKVGTEPDWQAVREVAENIAGLVRQWPWAVWAAERMVAVHGNTAQANSVFGCAATEGQLYQALATKANLESRRLYTAAVWRSSIGAATRKRDDAHARVRRWAADVWAITDPKAPIHELEALGIAVHAMREQRKAEHVAALPEQTRLVFEFPKNRKTRKRARPREVPEHLWERVAQDASE